MLTFVLDFVMPTFCDLLDLALSVMDVCFCHDLPFHCGFLIWNCRLHLILWYFLSWISVCWNVMLSLMSLWHSCCLHSSLSLLHLYMLCETVAQDIGCEQHISQWVRPTDSQHIIQQFCCKLSSFSESGTPPGVTEQGKCFSYLPQDVASFPCPRQHTIGDERFKS